MFGIKKGNGGDKRFEEAQEDATSLGNVLVEIGFITKDQLESAVEIQKKQAPHIGGILINMGILTQDQLEVALIRQKIARGKATDQEETWFYREHSHHAIGQMAQKFQETAELTHSLADQLANKTKG